MTQKQMLELVRQHHPEVGETQIRVWFNNALREFCRKTKILKTAYQFTTTADERWYGLPPYIVDIIDVDFDGYDIPRYIGKPIKRDLI
ncbi:MAG: hypothetical protein CMI54_00700 [Parcubacteria group bacterium]|nr:hypothetical protein [Parcubacteria group bacterium]|tara:strand:- start:1848 stop:2111 length:264 start_codon:yes stop_codon:yes gene_type:complete